MHTRMTGTRTGRAVRFGVDNPLPALREFREFQENLNTWLAEPPSPEPATVMGSYRFS